jgi:indolepyruvate ferredoxin oxidoreductase
MNVARYLSKLMSYKDEYEVARLHTNSAFDKKLAEMFEGEVHLNYHLAPPLFSRRNDKGELLKQRYGAWVKSAFGVLSKMKGLRGTSFDIFGRTAERKMERALIEEYKASIDELLQTLNAGNLSQAVEIARIPEEIRGYGHVKERSVKTAKEKWARLMNAYRSGSAKAA